MFQKTKRYENKEYKEFIKQQPCCVTGLMMVNDAGLTESDPHHTKSKGSGGSDLSMVPLTHELHDECHRGQETFQKKYNIDFRDVRLELMEKYIEDII